MSWTPKYTRITHVEGMLQQPINADTHPNTAEVLRMMEEVEAEMDAQLLWRYNCSGCYVDVEPVEGLSRDTISWFEYITTYGYTPSVGRVVIPDLLPIIFIRVSGCHERTTSLGASGVTWQVLQEGFTNDFLILRKQTKDGQRLGFALYFFQNAPAAGVQRIRLYYTYGWNLSEGLLQKYATLKTAIEVLRAKMGASEPAGLSQFVGGNFQTFVASNYAERIEMMESKCKELEDRYFPDRTSIALGVL